MKTKLHFLKVSARFIVIQTIKSLLVLRIYKCKIKKNIHKKMRKERNCETKRNKESIALQSFFFTISSDMLLNFCLEILFVFQSTSSFIRILHFFFLCVTCFVNVKSAFLCIILTELMIYDIKYVVHVFVSHLIIKV